MVPYVQLLLGKLMAFFESKDTNSFISNTLLIRFPIMLSVYIVYIMHKVMRRMVNLFLEKLKALFTFLRNVLASFSVAGIYVT